MNTTKKSVQNQLIELKNIFDFIKDDSTIKGIRSTPDSVDFLKVEEKETVYDKDTIIHFEKLSSYEKEVILKNIIEDLKHV